MTKKLLALLLVALFPATLFAEVRVPKFRSKTRVKHTQATQPVRGGGITERGPLTGAHAQGPITRGMQQGILRRMEVQTSKARFPATRSNPHFEWGRKLREDKHSWKAIKVNLFDNQGSSLGRRIKMAMTDALAFRNMAKDIWAEKENMPEHHFYFEELLGVFYWGGHFNATQLRDIRAFYEKAISHPDVFTSDLAFADGLSASLGIGFVGDAYLAEKIFSLAKQAPEGRRLLTDFTVVRSLLMLERYDLVQELMNFRQVQEGWFKDGQFVGGETASVYEEVKLYKQTIKDIPVTFSEELPAHHKFIFSDVDDRVEALMERRAAVMLFQKDKEKLGSSVAPENSAEGLAKILHYKQF